MLLRFVRMMGNCGVKLPRVVIVEPDRPVLDALEGHLGQRYRGQYAVVGTTSPEAALATSRQLTDRGDDVALVLVAQAVAGDPAGPGGRDLVGELRAAHPDASRALVARTGDVEAAMLAVNEVGFHGYVVAPFVPPDAQLYPVLDELLRDWRERAAVPRLVVEMVMDTGDAVARIPAGANLFDAAHLVARTQVGDLMVVDEGDAFVGVLSEGDILRNALPDLDAIVDAGGTLHDAYQLFVRRAQALAARPILPLVIKEPIVMRPGDHVAQAATILVERQIRRLPVVDAGVLVGTVSRANICQAIVGRV